jgi:hypothetical protein
MGSISTYLFITITPVVANKMDAVPQPPAKVQPPVSNVFNVYAASIDFIAQSTQIDHEAAFLIYVGAGGWLAIVLTTSSSSAKPSRAPQ